MPDLLERLEELAERHRAIEEELNLAAAKGGDDYRRLLREHARLTRMVEPYRELCAARARVGQARPLLEDPELAEIAREDVDRGEAEAAAAMERIKELLVQSDPDADRPAMLEIRAGTGGDEAALFAGDLARMYQFFAQRCGWEFEEVSVHPGEQGGLKEGIFLVRGEGAFGLLRFESGGHRVQRVPATESQGRIHTSAATVAVMPEAEEVDVEIRDEDLTIERKRAGGAGGQHVNKTESAIRLTHEPTGITVSCQDEKSQNANLDKAMKVLRARVFEREREQRAAERADLRRSQVGSGDRSERIRTYNFPQNRITDHRINYTAHNLDRYVEGDLEELQRAMIEYAKVQVLEEWEGEY